jgi:CBS domain-containing protein
MNQTLGDVMTRDPVALRASASLSEAARLMALHEIGDVIVLDDDTGSLCGVVTDRDIVVRALAVDNDPGTTPLGSMCSREVVCLTPSDTVDDAVSLMRTHAIRRLPVVADGRPVGVVSLGDLAQERDPSSALADISRAPATT